MSNVFTTIFIYCIIIKNNYHYLQFIATLLFFLAKLVEILSIDMKNVVFAIYYTLLYYTFTAVGPQNHSNTYVTWLTKTLYNLKKKIWLSFLASKIHCFVVEVYHISYLTCRK